MSYRILRGTSRRITAQARYANWLLRAYVVAVLRSFKSSQKSGGSRIAAILLSLVFFHFFPALVLASYMRFEGFFSYDMFKDGVSGVLAFYWWAEAILIVGAAYFAGSIYFIVANKIKAQKWIPWKSGLFWIALILNVFMLVVILGFDWNRSDHLTKPDFILTWLICAWVVFHIAIVFNASGNAALRSLGAGVFILTSVAFFFPEALALPYSLSLQQFGTGGHVPATIQLAKGSELVYARLILKSPENIYIQKEGSNSISVIALKDVALITIDAHSKKQNEKPNEKTSEKTVSQQQAPQNLSGVAGRKD